MQDGRIVLVDGNLFNRPGPSVVVAARRLVELGDDSGRKALFVNPNFTIAFEGWTKEESQPLLDYLYQFATQPAFCCRFQWQKGSLAMWDNRATQHLAVNDYHGHRRLMHRITLKGVPLNQG